MTTVPPPHLDDVPDLGKWPQLLVFGSPITEEQANEIIIRTTRWDMLCTNDKVWAGQIRHAVGAVDHEGVFVLNAARDFMARMGVLDVWHLANQRVAAPHLVGPHGWCDWDGTIGCANYNIGKYPSIHQVWQEWTLIAAAFPYLNITSQLVPREGHADHAVVEFRIADGAVSATVGPRTKIRPPEELTEATVAARLLNPTGERGVTLERLQAAIAQVRQTRPA